MPSIKFSDAHLGATILHTTTSGALIATSGSTLSLLSGGGTAGGTVLEIYKGTIPTNINTFTSRATRASDLLISFSLPGSTGSYEMIGGVNIGTAQQTRRLVVGKMLTPTSASASGLATWFLIGRAGDNLTDRSAMIGTVGAIGSGADLEVSNANIVAGVNYISNGLIINYPAIWNF